MNLQKSNFVRLFFIFLFVTITVFAVFTRQETMNDKQKLPIQLIVLKQSSNMNDHPLVAMYQYFNHKHVLAIYEVLQNDKYKFRAINSVEIDKTPTLLTNDKFSHGIWVKLGNNWEYFDENLLRKSRDTSYISSLPKYSTESQFDEQNHTISIPHGKQFLTFKENERPIKIFQLDENNQYFLVLYRNDVKVLVSYNEVD